VEVYVGQTRSRKWIRWLTDLGFGEVVQPFDSWPPRRSPWVLDNGAFADWQAGRPFSDEAWLSALRRAAEAPSPPAFGVCPDRVATGFESLAFSCLWLERCASALPVPWFLAVQDGMEADPVTVRAAVLGYGFGGLFVGGSADWKWRTGGAWVRLAHDLGVRCHVGRVGTADQVAWARRVGADSIDSCTPLWAEANLRRFVRALEGRQQELLP
jgi:hypothetical protein